MMTVGELRRALAPLDESVWVCIDGRGPVTGVVPDLGANEPFLVLVTEIEDR
jgi:hypothetical protein